MRTWRKTKRLCVAADSLKPVRPIGSEQKEGRIASCYNPDVPARVLPRFLPHFAHNDTISLALIRRLPHFSVKWTWKSCVTLMVTRNEMLASAPLSSRRGYWFWAQRNWIVNLWHFGAKLWRRRAFCCELVEDVEALIASESLMRSWGKYVIPFTKAKRAANIRRVRILALRHVLEKRVSELYSW